MAGGSVSFSPSSPSRGLLNYRSAKSYTRRSGLSERRRSSVRIRTGARPGSFFFFLNALLCLSIVLGGPISPCRRLSKFRDEMVHVRQEKVDTEVVTSLEEIGRESHIPPIVARESVHRIRADLEDLQATGNFFTGPGPAGLEVNRRTARRAFRGSVSVLPSLPRLRRKNSPAHEGMVRALQIETGWARLEGDHESRPGERAHT